VLAGVDLVLDRRERLGIVGANGTGKSTLIDVLAGRHRPTAGRIEVGPTVVVGCYHQLGVDLDPNARVQELVAGPHRSVGSLADIELMKRFLFTGELPYARVGSLSGGERRRLQLLLVIAGRPNVLFLDEPTNDLDLDTLRIVEDFLEDWPGALVVVSHDRAFLERTTERLIAVNPGGTVSAVPGGVSGWMSRMQGDNPYGATAAPISASITSARPAKRVPAAQAGSSGGSGTATGSPIGRRLREAEKEMVRLQRRRDSVAETLSGVTDYVELHRLGAALSAAQAALDQAEEQWLAVAEEAESG
jgi:ATP-binding cassette subfamily F protein uup